MKKVIALISALLFILTLTACTNTSQEQFAVYSFSGECENFAISNGTIVLTNTEDIFYGGNLHVAQPEAIKNIASYRAIFYTMIDGKQETILIDELDNTSSSELVSVDFGKMVFNNSEISTQFENIEEVTGKFWCELKITDTGGNTNSYSIALELIKITK